MNKSALDKPVIHDFMAVARHRRYERKHNIVRAGDTPQMLYLIIRGSVSVLTEDGSGREMVLAYLNAGDFFGEMCLFPEEPACTSSIRTRGPSLIAEIGREAFLAFSREHPEILLELTRQTARRLHHASSRLREFHFLDVAGRMARTLARLSREPDAQVHPDGAVVHITLMELARIVSCSRERAGYAMKRLEEEGLVRVSGRSILVPHGARVANRPS